MLIQNTLKMLLLTLIIQVMMQTFRASGDVLLPYWGLLIVTKLRELVVAKLF